MKFKQIIIAVATLGLSACGAADPQTKAHQLAAIADPTRPKADSARDPAQKAAEMLEFADIRQGQIVADILPGGGYWTRLFSKAVGPDGKVYGVLSKPPAAAPATPARAIAADPNYRNVTAVEADFANLQLPQLADMIWTSRNFRDFYRDGRDAAKTISKLIYRNLKPGGVLIVLDHAASGQMPMDQQIKLGRIDPAVVKADLESAGFQYKGEIKVLANPTDDHTRTIIDPEIAGHTDQFVYKFRKPG